MAQTSVTVGMKVKEIKWMGQFARGEVLEVIKISGSSVLLANSDGDELWDDISNVKPIESSGTMELPGYVKIFSKLLDQEDKNALQLVDAICKFGVKEVRAVKTDAIEGEYVTLNQFGLRTMSVYFVGFHRDTGKEVVEVVSNGQ